MDKFFTLERDTDNIVWLGIDRPDRGSNVLDPELLEAFDERLIQIAQTHPAGLVIYSAKPAGFIAGADVKRFARISNATAAAQHIQRVHQIFARLEALAFPSLAMIHGYCLGGGLELALACDYRIAANDADTRIGFPEVRLGIFPGYGGTARAIRLLGDLPALKLMLSGRTLDARKARQLGLIDQTAPQRQLRNLARRLLRRPPKPARANRWRRLPGLWPARQLLHPIMQRQLQHKVDPRHYPAPYALLEHWRLHAGSQAALLRGEAEQVAGLISGEPARNLIRVFLLQDRLKSLGERDLFQPTQVHLIGAGVMGGDIAAWCALQGLRVTLQDRSPQLIAPALGRARALFQRRLRDPYRVQQVLDRLIPDPRGDGVARADVVIEAIIEQAEAKRALFAELLPKLRPDALLASNTSSIPLAELARDLPQPNRLVGLHFFNPVARMPLLEVVSEPDTDPQMQARALSFARHIDKLPLPVSSSPGFLVNRVLMPYLIEAVELLDEGVSGTDIDRAAVAFGMPTGPVELADSVGLDVCLAVAEQLAPVLHTQVPPVLRERVEQGQLGRKSGQGFYRWAKGRAEKPASAATEPALQPISDRLILRLLNEAVACLREGVVADADLLDAGVIFGTGFAPFRGGPLHYVHQLGQRQCQQRLAQLETRYGPHFHADSGWQSLAI